MVWPSSCLHLSRRSALSKCSHSWDGKVMFRFAVVHPADFDFRFPFLFYA